MRVTLSLTWPFIAALFGCRDSTGPTGEPLQFRWHARLPFSGQSDWLGRPALDGGRLFVQDGNLALGLDAATGAILWSRPVRHASSPPPTSLLARDNRVYISETDSVLALNAETGQTIWNFHPDSQAVVVPAMDDATLYTGQRGIPVVYALSLTDGTLRWRANLGAGFQYTAHVEGLAVSGDTVYANVVRYLNPAGGQATGVLVALDRRDGHELWRWEAPGTAHSFLLEPIIAGRFVVVDDILGSAVHAFDPVAQREVWQVPHSSATRLYVHDRVVFVAGVGGYANAIDASSGAVRWNANGYGTAFGGAYCAGSFYMNESRLIRFDAATGRKTGQLDPVASLTFSSDIATDGASVFFTGADGAYRVDCN